MAVGLLVQFDIGEAQEGEHLGPDQLMKPLRRGVFDDRLAVKPIYLLE